MPESSVAMLRRRYEVLVRFTHAVLLTFVSAMGAGVYAALGIFTGNVAGDLFAEALKISLALAVASAVHLLGKWLFEAIAILPPERRRRLLPVVVLAFIGVVNISTYPVVIKYGENAFATEHLSVKAEEATRAKASIVQGIRQVEALNNDAKACQSEFMGMAEFERKGAYSGFSAQSGPLIAHFEGLARQCGALASLIADTGTATTALLAKVDDGLKAQHATVGDDTKALKDRILAMRMASEQFRGPLVEAASKLPISAVEGLGKSFLGRQAEPSLSSKAEVAAGQAKGIREARAVHEKYGAHFTAKARDLSKAVTALPPTFSMPGPAVLPILYWYVAVPIVAMALALDGLVFLLFVIAARTYDAIRDAEALQGPDAVAQVAAYAGALNRLRAVLSEDWQPLGPHPHPLSAQARARAIGTDGGSPPVRKNGRGHDPEGGVR